MKFGVCFHNLLLSSSSFYFSPHGSFSEREELCSGDFTHKKKKKKMFNIGLRSIWSISFNLGVMVDATKV